MDTVYHVTSSESLEPIAQEGLRAEVLDAFPDDSISAAELLLDRFRDERAQELGITRTHAVFSFPDMRMMTRPAPLIDWPEPGEFQAALAIEVDPEKALVQDMSFFNAFYDAFRVKIKDNLPLPITPLEKIGALYWGGALTLAQLRAYYEPLTDEAHGDYAFYSRRDNAPSHLTPALQIAEVLIPGPVAPDSVRWVASRALEPYTDPDYPSSDFWAYAG